MSKPIDYDSPRRTGFDTGGDSVEELAERSAASRSLGLDPDEAEAAEALEPSGADASDGELTAPVVPIQSDEFRCTRCFLVHHQSRLATRADGQDVCRECA
jgi:hypothetical protein